MIQSGKYALVGIEHSTYPNWVSISYQTEKQNALKNKPILFYTLSKFISWLMVTVMQSLSQKSVVMLLLRLMLQTAVSKSYDTFPLMGSQLTGP